MIKRFALALLLAVGMAAGAHAQVQQNVLHTETTVFTSAARVASANSTSQFSKAYKGVMLTLDVTAASGTTPTLDVKLQQLDTLSGQWVDLSGAVFQRITTTGQRTLTVYPSPEGRGNLRSITGTDPAANTEISETVPANTRWRPLLFRAMLVTDATVATRDVRLVMDDGTLTLAQVPADQTQAASLTISYTAFAGAPLSTARNTGAVIQMPDGIMLTGASRLRTQTSSLQATDNWGAPQYLVEEFIGNYSAIPLPRVWRAVATIAGTTPSFTFTLAGSYIP